MCNGTPAVSLCLVRFHVPINHQCKPLQPFSPRPQIMSKAARYSYSHGIWPADLLDERRVSITFRHSKPRPCAK